MRVLLRDGVTHRAADGSFASMLLGSFLALEKCTGELSWAAADGLVRLCQKKNNLPSIHTVA
jgi:hypothetical protein